ncbi:MAG: 2-amino-4-hydroxy-6-hydroxymethyldihydropteridine diphosphokinase [Desulfobulbaceae bacterium]|nr:2-amino-4-hydroxy-6-hydroxymethyldihydropteridine diphosphokinase [Desulfobulbaceae bacterium]
MALAFIGLGSNLGDGRLNLQQAWQRLGEHVGITILALSSPYLTRPVTKESWAKDGQRLAEQWFTNAAGVVETKLSPLELLGVMQAVEVQLGRDRQKTVDRTVDLDLIYYDERVSADEQLELPHPEIKNRLFVLAPLEELAPDRPHPVTGRTTRQMRRDLPESGGDDIRRLAWQDKADAQGAQRT